MIYLCKQASRQACLISLPCAWGRKPCPCKPGCGPRGRKPPEGLCSPEVLGCRSTAGTCSQLAQIGTGLRTRGACRGCPASLCKVIPATGKPRGRQLLRRVNLHQLLPRHHCYKSKGLIFLASGQEDPWPLHTETDFKGAVTALLVCGVLCLLSSWLPHWLCVAGGVQQRQKDRQKV